MLARQATYLLSHISSLKFLLNFEEGALLCHFTQGHVRDVTA
jgi:hypothetical protein